MRPRLGTSGPRRNPRKSADHPVDSGPPLRDSGTVFIDRVGGPFVKNINRIARNFLIVGLVSLLVSPCAPAAEGLAGKLQAVLNGPNYRSARWGVLVVDVATGRPVFAHNADQLFAPASVTKVFSCAAALIALGADFRFETPVHRRGPLTKGKLDGDLILVAQGDLTLGGRTDAAGKMAFANDDHTYATATGTGTALTDTDPLAGLKDLARQVKKAGIQSVEGDVLIDDRLFDRGARHRQRARPRHAGPHQRQPRRCHDHPWLHRRGPGQRRPPPEDRLRAS